MRVTAASAFARWPKKFPMSTISSRTANIEVMLMAYKQHILIDIDSNPQRNVMLMTYKHSKLSCLFFWWLSLVWWLTHAIRSTFLGIQLFQTSKFLNDPNILVSTIPNFRLLSQLFYVSWKLYQHIFKALPRVAVFQGWGCCLSPSPSSGRWIPWMRRTRRSREIVLVVPGAGIPSGELTVCNGKIHHF